jgi:hypothetical protein
VTTIDSMHGFLPFWAPSANSRWGAATMSNKPDKPPRQHDEVSVGDRLRAVRGVNLAATCCYKRTLVLKRGRQTLASERGEPVRSHTSLWLAMRFCI